MEKLTEKKRCESPRSIRLFIDLNGIDIDNHYQAKVIQRAWRRYKSKQRLKFFVNFITEKRHRHLRFGLGLWKLALIPPAGQAAHHYEGIFSFLFTVGHLKRVAASEFVRSDGVSLMSFDQYMKTNIMFCDPRKMNKKTCVAINVRFMMHIVRRMFHGWQILAVERAVLKKAQRRVTTVTNFRTNFGPEFWTFHVWRRYTVVRKRKPPEVLEAIEASLYVPEWRFMKANKSAQIRMKREANAHAKMRMLKRAILALKTHMVKSTAINLAYDTGVKNGNHWSLKLGFRAFMRILALKRFRQSIKQRVLFAWYAFIDKNMLNKMRRTAMIDRSELKLLDSFFKLWRKNSINTGIYMAYMHEQVIKRRLKLLPLVFLMKGDYVNYTLRQAFREWGAIIQRKRKVKMFVTWSFMKARKQTLIKFIFDVFRSNAELSVNRMTWQPFASEYMCRFTRNRDQTCIEMPQSNAALVIQAIKNIEKYKKWSGEWHKTASSNDVKTLFYRLIIAFCNKNALKTKSNTVEKIEAVKKYATSRSIFARVPLAVLWKRLHSADAEAYSKLSATLARDSRILMAYDAHSSAKALSNHIKAFTVQRDTGIVNDAQPTRDVPVKRDQDTGKDRRFPRGTKDHPLLRPIAEVKSSIIKGNRKFRRNPDDVGKAWNGVKLFNRRHGGDSWTGQSSGTLVNYQSMYESHVPIPKEFFTTRMMKQDLHLSTFKTIKTQILNKMTEEEDREEKFVPYEVATFEEPESEHEESAEEEEESEDDVDLLLPTVVKFAVQPEVPAPVEVEKKPEEPEEQPQTETHEPKKRKSVSIEDNEPIILDKLESYFIKDDEYFNKSQTQRVNILTAKFNIIREVLMSHGRTVQMKRKKGTAESQMTQAVEQTKMFKLIRRIEERSAALKTQTQSKQAQKTVRPPRQRKALFENPDEQFEKVIHDDHQYKKSACPEFANVLFEGDRVLTDNPLAHTPKEQNPVAQSDTPTSSRSIQPSQTGRQKPPPMSLTLPQAEEIVHGFEKLPTPSPLTVTSPFVAGNEALQKALGVLIKDKDVNEELKLRILGLVDSLAKRFLSQEQFASNDLLAFVDTDGIDVSDDEEAPANDTETQIQSKPPEIAPILRKKYAAFPCDHRKVKQKTQIEERKMIFCRDLVLAIIEGAKTMHKFDPLTNKRTHPIVHEKKSEKSTVRKVEVNRRSRQEEEVSSVGLNGVTPRPKPQRVRPSSAATKPIVRKQVTEELPVVTNSVIPQLNLPVTRITHSTKRKPQFTKMTPNKPPKQINFSTPRPRTATSAAPKNIRWRVDPTEAVTDSDIDLFIFVTPYIAPPEFLDQYNSMNA